jgi:hypothetical protein
MDRDIERTIQLRYKMITEWKAVGVDFQKIVYLLTKQDPTHIESEVGLSLLKELQ